jgi:heat shock protein HslJ
LSGCEETENNNPPTGLLKTWKLTELKVADIAEVREVNSYGDSSLTVTFYENGTASGKASVNDFTALFALDGSNISFSNVGTLTLINEDEDGLLFLELIEHSVSYELTDSTLKLTNNNGGFLKFNAFKKQNETPNWSICDPTAQPLPAKDLENYQVTLYKNLAYDGNTKLSYFVDDDIAILCDIGTSSNYIICNFKEFADNWEIPDEGINVVLSGKAYQYTGNQPAVVQFTYYLELTSFINQN